MLKTSHHDGAQISVG